MKFTHKPVGEGLGPPEAKGRMCSNRGAFFIAFLREEGGTRSVTEGECGIQDLHSHYNKHENIVAQAPSVSHSLDSSLSEGALRCTFFYR